MNSPIYTVVTNTSGKGLIVNCFSSCSTPVAAGESFEVEGDAWTRGDKNQRRSLANMCAEGKLSLVLKVQTPDGTYMSVAYMPAVNPVTVQQESSEAKRVGSYADNIVADHVITTHSAEASVAAKAYGVTIAGDVTPESADAAVFGPKNASVESDKTVVIESNSVIADGGVKVDQEGEAQTDPVLTVAEQFNALTAEKRWQDAWNLLVDRFGKEKITFTVNSVKSLKTYEAVLNKYKFE